MNNDHQTQNVGKLGEDIVAKHLENKGYVILGRNYRRKYGEIDLIAENRGVIHFVEVKTFSANLAKANNNLINECDRFRPEDNVHSAKLSRLANTISVYLAQNKIGEESEWQFDVVTVLLDRSTKKAKVEIIDNLIL